MSRTFASAPVKVGQYKGKDVFEASLESSTGVKITFLNYGALIRDWQVPVDGEAKKRQVVLGFDSFDHYPDHSPYFGAIVGRVANRIGGSKFKIDGHKFSLPANEAPNHLHGGPDGIAKQLWNLKILDDDATNHAIQFTLASPDKDQGYPGNLECTATYRLQNYRLRLTLEAKTDAPTPVNLTQHNYFNLEGDGGVAADHLLKIHAGKTLELGDGQLPTGQFLNVTETPLDFQIARKLKSDAGQPLSIDDSFVLDKQEGSEPVAILDAPDGKLTLKMWTDQPTVHVYTSGFLDVPIPGLHGKIYPRFGGICLEDQHFVDAVNQPNFPSCVLRPGEIYKHECEIEIAPKEKA